MKSPRWTAISESNFAWEKDALDWLREHLPDRDPWHAWSNFEFIDDEGKVNEVDALVISPAGAFLIEIKSRPGTVAGDAHTWAWETDGRHYFYDNPLILANRKAKRLASLLRRQNSAIKAKSRIPFIEPLIFLSAIGPGACKLSGPSRAGVFLRGNPDSPKDDGIVARLAGTFAAGSGPLLGGEISRVFCRAVIDAGIRPSHKHRNVGDYQLLKLIAEGENYQDWEGKHVSVGVLRRVRVYGYALAATSEARKSLVRQATREFQILEGINHPGILSVKDFKESELGPALLFDYESESRRLDFVLKEQGDRLNVDQRLVILRQLAETLKYAHEKKLYHRALSPQSILVRNPADAQLRLQIVNWQLAARDGSTLGTHLRTVGTQHLEAHVEDPASVFLAPESLWDSVDPGPHLDVFSLGAIAWQVFTGKPPAAGRVELNDMLRSGNGLRISDCLDGAGSALQDLIQYSTCPDVMGRIRSMTEFLEYLEWVEDELTAPSEQASVDPSVAKTDDRLEGGFIVVRRIGKGSSADVLLVKRDGSDEEIVLKVAIDATHNDRLVAEGETLGKLRHSHIVEWIGTVKIAGRVGLLMKSAGKHTLAHHLRQEARPSLDLIRRYGEELLQIAAFLEDQGVYHRDIKPDNIGLIQSHSGKLQLVLFDFSLSRVSVDNIQAGTRPYLDPFLPLRKPPRWDLYAERFAVAMTLHEMVTGILPTWGDGVSDPSMIDDEASLDVSLFDPNLREGLTSFFAKALRRDCRERYDNAEDMLRAWRAVFDQAETVHLSADSFALVAQQATRETSISELGYSVEAQNVLDRMGIHNVRELLGVDRIRFRYLKNVGDKVRKEIRLKAKRLAQLRPDLITAKPSVLDPEAGASSRSVDELVAQLLPRRPADEERPEETALAVYLGIEVVDGGETNSLWPSIGVAAQSAGIGRPALTNALMAARARWLKLPSMTEVREELATALGLGGGVLTVAEAAAALLASRGSTEQDDDLRVRLAAAVIRAVVEAEADLANPRYQFFPGQDALLIAETVDHADYAIRLGQAADRLLEADDATGPLQPPQQVLERLEAVDRPACVAPLSSQRLVKLASVCSVGAALSSRMEIYPKCMAAQRALRLAMGSLTGPRMLKEEQVRERVAGRFPEAEALPHRPALDAMLADAGSDLSYRQDGNLGPGYYAARSALDPTAGSTSFIDRLSTHLGGRQEVTPDVADARSFEERLDYSTKQGGFLVLTVPPRLCRRAESELITRFAQPLNFRLVSLDAVILEALRAEAQALRVDWRKVLEADRDGPGSRDWGNLMRLVAKAKPRISAQLLSEPRRLLLLHPGLLARLDLMDILSELQSATSRPDGLPLVWLLAPTVGQGLPTLDGVPIPVISPAHWSRIPEAWLSNIHRAAA